MKIPESFAGISGGHGIVARVVAGGLEAALMTASTDYRDIYGWTSGRTWQVYAAYSDQDLYVPSQVRSSGLIAEVLLGEADTFYLGGHSIRHPVYFDMATGKMSLSKGTKNALIGTASNALPRYHPARDKQFHGSVVVNGKSGTTDDTVLDLDNTVNLDAPNRPSGFGDKRIVVCDTRGEWSDDETLTVQGNGGTLSTMDQGSAVMWKIKDATQDDEGEWSIVWELVTGEQLFDFLVDMNVGYWRAEMDKLMSKGDPIHATEVASTQGVKQTWTVTTDAPTGTQSSDDGWLTVPGIAANTGFFLTGKESDETVWDPHFTVMTATVKNHELCDGNCIVQVGPKGIRVNQIASSGVPGYTVDVKVAMLGT